MNRLTASHYSKEYEVQEWCLFLSFVCYFVLNNSLASPQTIIYVYGKIIFGDELYTLLKGDDLIILLLCIGAYTCYTTPS